MYATLFLGLAMSVSAPGAKTPPKAEAPKLEGEWLLESMEGPKEAKPGEVTFKFTDGKISIMEAKRNQKAEEADYTVDFTKKPAEIDLKPSRGGKEMTIKGIIEVKGDAMKLCFGREGDRPTEFKGDAAKMIMLATFKRVKAEK